MNYSDEDSKKAAEILGHIVGKYEGEMTQGVVLALISHLKWIVKR